MLEQVLAYLRNYFVYDTEIGTFEITKDGFVDDFPRFIRVYGSIYNDGVYDLNKANDFTPEKFIGKVDFLAIPKNLLITVEAIDKYVSCTEKEKSPYTSESFGGYSYTKKTNANGAWSWKDEFAEDLKQWRKL